MRQLMEQKKSNDQEECLPMCVGPPGDVIRRNNRGCKSRDFYHWPELPFEAMDSPLGVQQYIQQLIRRNPTDVDVILQLPEGQDLGAWKIEHLRLFCMQLNRLATKLQDCCYPETCNQMTATEQWIFLCAAHKQPNECPAIDYTRHTLDGAASLLNSNKYFPSRVTIKESSVAKLGSVCRRIYRIFSHAYYHHFQVFEDFEKEFHLCKRFSKFVTMYDLMPKESLIVPADGSKPEVDVEKAADAPAGGTTNVDGSNIEIHPTTGVATNTTAAPAESEKNAPNSKDLEPEKQLEKVETKTNPPVSPAATTATETPTVIDRSEPKSQDGEASPPAVGSKKSSASPMTTSPPKSTTWMPSTMSTNTMVKTSAKSSTASEVKKAKIDSENKTPAKLGASQTNNSRNQAAS